MFKSLPPVGNPILLMPHPEPEVVFSSTFGTNQVYLYASGTMALAAALVAVRECRAASSPEVLLPAYGCPDLISASIYAGLRPVLVDLVPDRPWMDLGKLQKLIGPNTVAVIAMHFLGLPDRLQDIRSVLEGTDVMLVEDSAQLFPRTRTDTIWQGDMVVLSFGRGKPVSLLGGGAVISRNVQLGNLLPFNDVAISDCNSISRPNVKFKIKTVVYNKLLSPFNYGIVKRLPFLQLGTTEYKKLNSIEFFENSHKALLAANISTYRKREQNIQVLISNMMSRMKTNNIIDLPTVIGNADSIPLLRYPILFKNQAQRDHAYDAMTKVGLGVSKMYERILPEIMGLKNIFENSENYPIAANLAERLLTLPCHAGVSERDVRKLSSVLDRII